MARKTVRVLIGAALLTVAAVAGAQQGYPNRPIKLIVPWPPGGGVDTAARVLSQPLAERLGQPIVVDNKPGVAGNLGTAIGAKEPPDGYTLIMGSLSPNSVNPHLYSKLGFDPIKDFEYVGLAYIVPSFLVVPASSPANSAKDLVAIAKASPGKLNLASGGIGSTGHMSAELFQMMAGIKFTHVPYRGEAPALTDLIAGQAQVMVSTTGSSLQYAKAGTVRAVATTTDDRVTGLPDLQPLSQTVPGYQANGWNGLCAPKGTPAAIITLLNREVNLAMADPKIKERMASLGGVALPGSPEDYGRTIAADTEKWGKVVQFSGAQVN